MRVEGEAGELAAGLDVTAYRVVQEALAAALDVGGAGRADVTVRFGADVLEIDVRDDGPLVAPRPLAGVRERVTLHGGRLTLAHRRSGGGHIVHATLPLDGQAMAGEEPEPVPCELAVRRDRVLRRLRDARPRRPEVFDATLATAARARRDRGDRRLPRPFRPARGQRGARARLHAPARLAPALAGRGHRGRDRGDPRDGPHADARSSSCSCRSRPCSAAPTRCGLRESYPGLALVVAALPAITATMDDRVAADYFFPCLLVTVTWLAGRTVRARTRLTAELHEAAAQLAEASAEEQQLAASDERRRIAREMHDLVAHSMSVMVVQAGGARRILDRDPGRALEAATRIERTGREALGEMRHLLGVPQRPRHAVLAPQPTLAEIGELVARARAAGLPTVLEFRGERRDAPGGLDLAAYRIVQEALTNAIKHAGHAPTTVTVDWGEHALTLEIRDHGERVPRTGDGGHGLVGMRERVRLYGGELEAGPPTTAAGACARRCRSPSRS